MMVELRTAHNATRTQNFVRLFVADRTSLEVLKKLNLNKLEADWKPQQNAIRYSKHLVLSS